MRWASRAVIVDLPETAGADHDVAPLDGVQAEVLGEAVARDLPPDDLGQFRVVVQVELGAGANDGHVDIRGQEAGVEAIAPGDAKANRDRWSWAGRRPRPRPGTACPSERRIEASALIPAPAMPREIESHDVPPTTPATVMSPVRGFATPHGASYLKPSPRPISPPRARHPRSQDRAAWTKRSTSGSRKSPITLRAINAWQMR